MKIKMKCFATLSADGVCDWKGSTEHEIESGETVRQLVGRLNLPEKDVKIVFLNGRQADGDSVLHDGDQLALAPSVGGM